MNDAYPEQPIRIVMALDLKSPADVRRALDRATSSEFAIVFVHVDWAPMGYHRKLYEEFAARFIRERADLAVSFHYINFTWVADDYAPLGELNGWDSLRSRLGHFPIGGKGEIVWLRRGIVVDCESIIRYKEMDELMSKTAAIFGANISN